MSTSWDYTELAPFYDKRADYSERAIKAMVRICELTAGSVVGDIGAGTGKLTRPLLQNGMVVHAVEPNEAMRAFGIKNTAASKATWHAASAENTGLDNNSIAGYFMGSSFNVVNQPACLAEAARTLTPEGWFSCMWNHRELDDPVQSQIEIIIRKHVASYAYGSRREDPTTVINTSGLFQQPIALSSRFLVPMSREDIVEAWRSHATLQRQAGDAFDTIIKEISAYLDSLNSATINVPYITRLWLSQKN